MRQPLETPHNKYFCGAPEHVGLVDDVPPSPAPDWADIARAAWDAASWQEAAAEYPNKNRQPAARMEPKRLNCLQVIMGKDVSLERTSWELNDQRRRVEAAAATVEALMFGLRDGIDVLPTKSERLRRLSELSAEQLKEVCARLQNFKPTIARPWTADEVAALVTIWGASHA
jgi:hypothetical protein